MRPYTAVPADPRLDALIECVRARFGNQLVGVLLYGSCRRSGDYGDGIVDLYAVVERRAAVEGPLVALLGRWLPPNVYYLQTDCAGETLRCKCGLFALDELARGVDSAFHSYIWARLAQPMALVHVRDADAEHALQGLLAQAVLTFVRRCGRLAPAGRVTDLWTAGLRACYAAELRVESGDRAAEIVRADPGYYADVGAAALSLIEPNVGDGPGRWWLRRVLGKLLSLARLVKGLGTFDGAIDYIVWKLERHSGQDIEVPQRVRRWPWLFVWPFAWRLYRAGVFR